MHARDLSIAIALALALLAPGTLGLTWLRLDDPPPEGAGDTVATAAFTDGFESGGLGQWTNGGAAKWQVSTNRRHGGAYAAFVNAGGGGTSLLTSIPIDVSNASSRLLSFWWQMTAKTNDLRLQLDIYDGTWHTNVWSVGAAGADNTWRQETIDLAPYAAAGTLQLRFSFTGGSGGDKAWLDDVLVTRDHPSADIVDLYYTNDGTYLYLLETLAAAPDPGRYTYLINIDKPTAGVAVPDFRVLYTRGISVLQRWNGTLNAWQDLVPVQVTAGATNLTFRLPLASLANPDLLQDMDLYFANLQGVVANPPLTPPGVDHAADQGVIHIPSNNVAEVPLWPTLPLLLGALGITLLGILRRRGLLPPARRGGDGRP